MGLTFSDRLALAIARSPFKLQKALADALGVGENTVSNWCTDKQVPSGDFLLQLPKLLGVSADWLLTGEGEMEPTPLEEARWKLQQIKDVLNMPYPPPAPPPEEPEE